nr:DMT family transporter [Caballeronia sp. ATUFL_F1_KS4A]
MKRISTVLLFIVVVLIWSSTWTAMSIAVETIPPVTATALRFLVASPLLLILLSLRRAPLLFPRGQRWLQFLITAGYFIIPFSLLMWGEQRLSPRHAALLAANMPVIVLFLSVFLLNERLCYRKISGLALSSASLFFILHRELDIPNAETLVALLAFLVALVLHGFFNVQLKKHACYVPALTFNALPCTLAGLVLLAAALIFEHPSVDVFSTESIGAVVYLAVFANVVAILSFFKIQQSTSPSKASIVFAVFPLVAIAIDGLRYGQTFAATSIALTLPLITGLLILAYSPTKSVDENAEA